MPRRGELTISKQSVDGLSVEGKEAVFWDRELPGFGVRVYPSGTKIYVSQCRGPNGIKRLSLGRHGEITADEARKQAAAAIARIKQGEDPSARPLKRALTVADLAERYMEGHVKVHCNAHTQGIYAGSLRNHILPAVRRDGGDLRRTGRGCGVSLPSARDAAGCEPGADGVVEDIFSGGGVGPGAAGRQPVPFRAALQGGPPRALPDGGRVPPGRLGAARA